jgi:cyclin B
MLSELCKLCMNQYERVEFLMMERQILRVAKVDIDFPLSYSFLRRYARVLETIDMRTLTLARLILEVSLHYYKYVF